MASAVPLLPPKRSKVIALVPTSELGEAMSAEQVRNDPEFPWAGRVSRDWVLDTVAPEHKFYAGRQAVWYRGDVRAWVPVWVASQRARVQARRRRR